jgi:hypothetical protein
VNDHRSRAARTDPPLDHRGSRRLTGREQAVWYLVAGITYVVAALNEKALLTWLVGPAWVVVVLWFGPPLVDRLTGRVR